MSAYLARGELGRDPVAGASEYLAAHPGKEAALWGGLFAPEKADERFRGLENAPAAWAEAARAERQRNGQVAEHFIIALPKELSLEQNRWALQDHIRQFTRDGRLVQAAIHADERGGSNMHAHLLVSTRKLNEQGFERLKAHDQQSRFMHREEYVRGLREAWAHVVNRHLERHKVPERVDHRSWRAQGIDREPERHMGAWAAAKERDGVRTRVGDHNRAVRERNAERERTGAVYRPQRPSQMALEQQARRLSPEYRQAEDELRKLRAEAKELADARRGYDNAKFHAERDGEKRWQRMGWLARKAHETGLWQDKTLVAHQEKASRAEDKLRQLATDGSLKRAERAAEVRRPDGTSRERTVADIAKELSPNYREAIDRMWEARKERSAAKAEIRQHLAPLYAAARRRAKALRAADGWERRERAYDGGRDREMSQLSRAIKDLQRQRMGWDRHVKRAEREVKREFRLVSREARAVHGERRERAISAREMLGDREGKMPLSERFRAAEQRKDRAFAEVRQAAREAALLEQAKIRENLEKQRERERERGRDGDFGIER